MIDDGRDITDPGGDVLDEREWISPPKAAQLWHDVRGVPISAQTMRNYCKSGWLEERGVEVQVFWGSYYVRTASLLDYFIDNAAGMLDRAQAKKEELERELREEES